MKLKFRMLESFVIQLNQNLDELQSFIAQAFSPIKILNSVQVRIIALLEPRNGVTGAVWQSALGLVRGGGG